MTQYRLKKETFGIPAGTIAEEHDGCCYVLDYFEAGDRIERSVYLPNRLLENDHYFEKVEEPKKWARAVIKYDNGNYKSDSKLFSNLEDAVAHFSRMHFGAGSIIWPARFDDEGYLIMEGEQ